MSGEITTIIVSALVAAVSAPLGAWVNSRVLRQKYRIEIAQLRAEMEDKLAEVKSHELDNVRKASDILMENIVKPLKTEIQSLRRDVSKFRKAVEQIPMCPMAGDCPASRELHRTETDDARDKPDS